MSPTQFHAKQEQHDTGGTYDHHRSTPPKIINKDSTFNHRLPPPPPPPPPSSAGSSTNSDNLTTKPQPQPPRRPLIIYTHSPKVIHTHPRDFMALVQKLTGYTPPPDETPTHPDPRNQRGQGGNTEENESTSVVTEEHGSSVNDIGGGPQVNSCFADGGVAMAPPSYKAAGFDPYFNPTAGFPVNPTDYLCPHVHQLQFYNQESMFMNRNSSRALREYPDI